MASSTPYWMIGLSTIGSISLGWALVAGRKRVPRPAAGNTALRTFMGMVGYSGVRSLALVQRTDNCKWSRLKVAMVLVCAPCRPYGTRGNSLHFPVLPCRALTFRRFAAGVYPGTTVPGLHMLPLRGWGISGTTVLAFTCRCVAGLLQ